MWKGLTGGYDATYSDQHFFAINHMYSEKDLRDQWSYRLNISDSKKKLIVAHIWEVLGYEFKYYFFNRNCGYYVADTFQLIIDDPLMRYGLPWAFPSAIFDYLSSIETDNGESLVESVSFYPSRQTRFYQKYEALSASLKDIVQKSISDDFLFRNTNYQALSTSDKVSVLDALLDYNAFLFYKSKGKNKALKQQKQALILERLKLKTMSPKDDYEVPIAPHFGQRPSKLAVSIGQHSSKGIRAYGNFRAAYYDHLAISPGRPPHSLLKMADLHMLADNGSVSVSKLTLVEIEKLGITKTGLPSDAGHTWHLDLGVYKRSLSDVSAKDWTLTAGYGKAKKLNSHVVGFVMLDAVGIMSDSKMSYVSPRVSGIVTSSQHVATQLTSKWTPSGLVSEIEVRVGSSRKSDIRVSYVQDVTHELRVSTAYYF
jgi:hypothetical protein